MSSLATVLSAWGIERAMLTKPEFGTLNETWFVEAPGIRAVLRRHRTNDRSEVAFEHRVLGAVRAAGLACPEVLPSTLGAHVVGAEGSLHTLYSWMPGRHERRHRIDSAKALDMGRTLGRIHTVLASVEGGPRYHPLPSRGDAIELIDAIAATLSSTGAVGDEWMVDHLLAQRRWLEEHPDGVEAPDDAQLVHGDYQDTNMLFVGDLVSAVLDWDKARVSSRATEVVRCIDYALDTEPHGARAFLAGYRREIELDEATLLHAVEHWTHHRARSTWTAGRIAAGDERVRALTRLEPFVPFADRWSRRLAE